MISALALGALVGLGIAVPLGAIGVLLLQTGMLHGWRPAAAGGVGAALVDLGYACAAVVAGGAVATVLAGREQWVSGVGAVVLAGVAIIGALRALRSRTAGAALSVGAPLGATPARALLRFIALTAVNPLTVVYFAAIAAGFADRLAGVGAKVAFVLGIGIASAAWQLALAAAGSILGARVTPRVRTGLALLGYGVVGGFAFTLAMR